MTRPALSLSLATVLAVALAGCASPPSEGDEAPASAADPGSPDATASVDTSTTPVGTNATEPVIIREWLTWIAGAVGPTDAVNPNVGGPNGIDFRVPEGYTAMVSDLYWNDTAQSYGLHLYGAEEGK